MARAPKASTPKAVQDCHQLLHWMIPQLDKFPRVRRFTLLVGHVSQIGLSNQRGNIDRRRKCQPIFFIIGLLISGVVVAQGTELEQQTLAPAAPNVAPASSNKGGVVTETVLPPLIGNPQPPCQFNPNTGPEMVVIPGGHFLMGSPQTEQDRDSDEGPEHWVAVQPFAMGRCEVTRREFQQFIDQTAYQTSVEIAGGCFSLNASGDDFDRVSNRLWQSPGFDQDDQHPVTCVSFDDALAYIAWLNQRTGLAYRLPTEAEWEYAARGSSNTRFSFGNDEGYSDICTYANSADQSMAGQRFAEGSTLANCLDDFQFTSPVGRFSPNPFGLYDMHGNLLEWTNDCWSDTYQGAPVDGSAWLAGGDCSGRMLRGGSWLSNPWVARSADRGGSDTDVAIGALGFRLARTLSGSTAPNANSVDQ